MKILLIQPNREFHPGSFDAYGCIEMSTLPLGLLYLASAIRKKHEVRVLDCLMDDKTRIYRKGGVLHHGLAWAHIKRHIEDFDPDAIGLTILFTAQENAADKILKMIRKHFPEKKIILGGCAISVNYEKYVAESKNTYAITGEGELSLPLLLEHFENPEKNKISDVPGLVYLTRSGINTTPLKPICNLDSIGFPSYDLIDMERYRNRRVFLIKKLSAREQMRTVLVFLMKCLKKEDRKRDVTVFTSRGCPFNCVFCSIHSQFGFRWRPQTPEHVVQHIKFLVKNYGIDFIHFGDDNLALSRKRIVRILDGLKKNRIQIKWDTPNGMRADTLDEELLLKMKKAGCVRIYVAIESGSERVRNHVMGKNPGISKIISVLDACQRAGISTGAFYIIGFPGETRKEMLETITLARELREKYNTEPTMFIAQPLPGTDLLKECVEQGVFTKKHTDPAATSGTCLIGGKDMGSEDAVRIKENFIYTDKTTAGKALCTLKAMINRIL